ncbi:unnamed protein product [Rodentolepis nana]|uniref:Leucine Rich repeat-containing domain protein n=1 Tax=Rodentolepis nana TaxID=102285 RepID=A0A0R3TAT2_RODNA|nr:unnamed protein product [Rodentolepis nana]
MIAYLCVSFAVESASLMNLCLKAIVDNFDSLVTKCDDCAEPKLTWRLPCPDYAIPSPMADMILKRLSDRRLLKQEHLALFSKQYVDLQSLSLRDFPYSPSLIPVLHGIDLNDFISAFSERTVEALHTLNVRGMCIEEETKLCAMDALGQFQNLSHLDISRTNLDSQCLNVLVKSLKRLAYLDISETEVVDITCGEQSLRQMLLTILELKELRTLEIANFKHHFDQLIEPGVLPHLKHLEMGGNPLRFTLRDIELLRGENVVMISLTMTLMVCVLFYTLSST